MRDNMIITVEIDLSGGNEADDETVSSAPKRPKISVKYSCKICKVAFGDQDSLEKHQEKCKKKKREADLQQHYAVIHTAGTDHFSVIQRMFRAEIGAHLGETDPKLQHADKKVNVSDKKKAIIKRKEPNKNDAQIIYKCKCGKATETYDASVEHSQEHLVAKHNGKEMGDTRDSAFEADVGDNNVFKVIKYDFESLLTDESKGKAAKTGRKDNVTNSDTKKQKCVFCMPASGHKNMPRCPLCNVFDDVDDKELFAKHLSDYHNVDLSRYSKNTKGGENCKGKKRASQENEGGQIQVDQKARPSTFHGSGNFQVPCEQSPGCAEPKAVLIRSTDIPTDGNCFFYSIIKILKLSLTPSEIRRLLLVSPFVDSCIDPAGVRTILSSDRKYPEMDCIHIFSKVFDKNLCIHNHYVDSNTNEEVRQYVHFRVNTSQSFLHLHLQNAHYTPFIEISFY